MRDWKDASGPSRWDLAEQSFFLFRSLLIESLLVKSLLVKSFLIESFFVGSFLIASDAAVIDTAAEGMDGGFDGCARHVDGTVLRRRAG